MNTAVFPSACVSMFSSENLPLPPLPIELANRLQADGATAFCTPGAPKANRLEEIVTQWAQAPAEPTAWLGFTGHGIQSTAVRLCIGLPEAGFFLQKKWTEVFEQGDRLRLRIEGSFELLTRALDEVLLLRAAGRWPQGQRLLLIDDDFDRLRWGWLPVGANELQQPQYGAMAYLDLLDALDALKNPAIPA